MRRARGEVREAILDAAMALLRATGDPAKVTIDAVVNEVGCTPPALYYYFPTKDELLFQACRREYARFAADLMASTPITDDPLADLNALGLEYVRWARSHPAQYQLLFMTRFELNPESAPPPTEFAEVPGLAELIAALRRAEAELEPPAAMRFDDINAAAFGFWAIVHGFASLAIVDPTIPQEFLETMCVRTCHGLALTYRLP